MSALISIGKLLIGQATLAVTIIIICLVTGYLSSFIWGDNNLAEKIAECIIEKELGLPNGTIDLNHSHTDK